jgi:uncharacterized membrane protein
MPPGRQSSPSVDARTLKPARGTIRSTPGSRAVGTALLLFVAVLSGCSWLRAPALPATPSLPEQPPRLLAEGWRCEDGRTVGTRILPGLKTMELRVDALRRNLPQVASASGARFEDAEWLFWNRGAQAMLQRKPSPPVYCNEVRSLSLLEDARARGITFRGRGNEPGWLVEVGPAGRVVLSGMQGGPDILQRQAWPDLQATPGPVHGSTRYTGESAGRRYVIVVMPDPCIDDMTGERFPAVVRLEVDGRRLRGCGTPIAP